MDAEQDAPGQGEAPAPEVDTREAVVTCRTPECDNGDLAITAPISWPDYMVVCGGCGMQVEDIQVMGAYAPEG